MLLQLSVEVRFRAPDLTGDVLGLPVHNLSTGLWGQRLPWLLGEQGSDS